MEDGGKLSLKRGEPESHHLAVYNCGVQCCAPGHTWGPGLRDHFLIHLITAGRGVYETGGARHSLGKGDLFLAWPQQLISYQADDDAPWEYSWVGFNGVYAHTLVQGLPFSPVQPFFHSENAAPLADALSGIYKSWGPAMFNETRMTGHLYLFCSLLMEEASRTEDKTADLGSRYTSAAVKYIQHNYAHNISVDDIAAAVGLSRSHLYRVFMHTVGQSPIDYLTEYRIGEACALLQHTALSIAEIAYSVGIEDQFYFSRVFKKLKGVPPSRYLAHTKGES